MSNELLNWHVLAGEPYGSDITLSELADEAGYILNAVTQLARVLDEHGCKCLTPLPLEVQRAIIHLYSYYIISVEV